MPAFLSKSRGVVTRVESVNAQLGDAFPFAVRITDVDSIGNKNGTDSRVLITQVSRNESGSYQLQHTFGNTIYAYIFGDRVGEFKLSGVCFTGGCDNRPDGIAAVHDTYEANRIAARNRPMIITCNKSFTLIGLLTGSSMEMVDPETQLMQWSFRFNTFRAVG